MLLPRMNAAIRHEPHSARKSARARAEDSSNTAAVTIIRFFIVKIPRWKCERRPTAARRCSRSMNETLSRACRCGSVHLQGCPV